MEYLIIFLNGILTFISPCLLPMLPIYISYLAGNIDNEKKNNKKVLLNAFGFVTGFSLVFVVLGFLSSTLGKFVIQNAKYFNIFGGIIIILFGLHFANLIKIPFLDTVKRRNVNIKATNFFSAAVFGIIFGISWTPCVSAFLGTALILAATSETALKGVALLFTYSLGLGIPFIISAVLINQLKEAFSFIKKHYKIINLFSGLFLICLGIAMISGYFNTFLGLFSK